MAPLHTFLLLALPGVNNAYRINVKEKAEKVIMGKDVAQPEARATLEDETGLALSGSESKGKVCLADVDCCGDGDVDKCSMFCQAGTEIVKEGAKGWFVKGTCETKWDGFCKEDEECGFGRYCERSKTSLVGTCTKDTSCDEVTCKRGQCRNGECTCDFGVVGEHCDHTLEAFAFLYYGNSTENLVTTRVLLQSLRSGGALQDFIAVIPKSMKDTVPEDHLEILKADGVIPYFSDPIPMPISMDKDIIIHARWSGVMNKFAVWRLTQYTQVALLDTDMVFSFDGDNPMDLFTECTANLCAVRDGDPRFMNAGVIVITPSEQRLTHILHVLHKEQHHFAMPEQSFLTEYCRNPSNRMTLQYMDKKWNSCVGGGMLHNVGWESTGYNILHSCSWMEKPPEMAMCRSPKCEDKGEWHTVLQWQMFHEKADPCIANDKEAQCSGNCTWCGHYCSTSKIACSTKLFKKEKERDGDAPTDQLIEEVLAHKEASAGAWPRTDVAASYDSVPRGSWAWPQVGMYQILIDRFATSDEKTCDNLADYCGGNFAGIKEKLPYLEELGIDGILMSPVVEQMPHAYHGYHAKNLYNINPEYGTSDELVELVSKMHAKGMKVTIDVNLNNAGMIDSSNASEVAQVYPFNRVEDYHADNCSLMHNEDYERGAYFLEHCKLYGLADYDHENPHVWDRLNQWVRDHVDTYAFDGIRVDAARHISKPFLESVPETGAPLPAFFEVVNGDMSYVVGYTNGEYSTVYNYPLYFTLKDIFVDLKPMSDLATWMQEEAPKAQNRLMLNFIENNDLPRFVYKLDNDMKLYHNALLCMLGMEGLPILLFGGEQDAFGLYDPLDPLKVDNWRPPTWHDGYNTSAPTYKLIQKVLWTRGRLNGMHHLKQHPVYTDHKVVVFRRGPVIFAVTNAGEQGPSVEQRVVWDNATNDEEGPGAFVEPSYVCNLLSDSPLDDCLIVAPGNITRYRLNGEPKMYIPWAFAKEYLDEQSAKQAKKDAASDKSEGAADNGNGRLLYTLEADEWSKMPESPEVGYKVMSRVQRPALPSDMKLEDEKVAGQAFPHLPPHLDQWSPSVGVPLKPVQTVSIKDACVYTSESQDSIVYAKRGEANYVLIDDGAQISNENALEASLKKPASVQVSVPLLDLTRDEEGQDAYHFIVHGLPMIAPHLEELRSGAMGLFGGAARDVLTPILTFLGITDAAYFLPEGATSHSICAPQLLFEKSLTQEGPKMHLPSLNILRGAVEAATGALPSTDTRIVILSGGQGIEALRNENDLSAALGAVAPTRVMNPASENFSDLVGSLQEADIVVGAHGALLSNLIFARDHTKVVEILPTSADHRFRDLAGALNFEYVPTRAKAESADGLDVDVLGVISALATAFDE